MQTHPQPSEVLRFYELLLQEDLLGGWSLVRQWGQLGSRGTLRKDLFPSQDEAQAALVAQRDRQLGRGYQVMFIHGSARP
ncbi:MAG: WGR domain-containing protein [Lysobacterales bacterium]